MDARLYDYWFNNIEGIGIKTQKKILKTATVEEVFEMTEQELKERCGVRKNIAENIVRDRDVRVIEEEYDYMLKQGCHMASIRDEEYPKLLKEIYDNPYGLYYAGQLPDEQSVKVAIVGARGCSEYGKRVAYRLAKELAMAGVEIISGMAIGIDTYAHKGALDGGGRTYAVLAGGVDVCYPNDNISLYEAIKKNGGVVSEFPVGIYPAPGFFPIRNRIISGMSNAVVVVEARLRSGSLITADQALEQNRQVYVVPGRWGDPLSEGCLSLARQGAHIITSARDILEDFGLPWEATRQEIKKISLAPSEKMLYSCLCLIPKNLNTLVRESCLEIDHVVSVLVKLQLEGLVREVGCNSYVRTGDLIIDGI